MSQKKKKQSRKPDNAPAEKRESPEDSPQRNVLRHWPWAFFALALLYVIGGLMPPKSHVELDHVEWGKFPVLKGGRTKPMDSLARNTLRKISHREVVPLEGNAPNGEWGNLIELKEKHPEGLYYRRWYQFGKHPKKLQATQWLLELFYQPEIADQRFIFRVDHPDLASELNLNRKGIDLSGIQFFSFRQLQPALGLLSEKSGKISQKNPMQRDPHENATYKLAEALHTYMKMRISLQANFPTIDGGLKDHLDALKEVVPNAAEESRKASAGEEHNQDQLKRIESVMRPYAAMADDSSPREKSDKIMIVPPMEANKNPDDWHKVGESVLNSVRSNMQAETEDNSTRALTFHPALEFYGRMGAAFTSNNAKSFNAAVADYKEWLHENHLGPELAKVDKEHYFNHFGPFGKSKRLYVIALVLACLSWLSIKKGNGAGSAAFYLVGLAFVIHTTGIIFRMWLEGRPPVTNLYSSAIFVGWGAVILGWLLERMYRNGIGSFVASIIGFCTLLIADQLAMEKDTMEMMRAVLDTNFWLATHVVCISLGYAATFLAGFLAIVYVLRGTLTKSMTREMGQSLGKLVYGTVCFATLFSFVGTVLGGIWADQSWGRFWGWDAKENGALLIVIWNAIILHCRWGGFVKDRGLAALAIVGNIVTAWSWFGVNMLGIGLHSYGFMGAAFNALKWFAISQLVIVAAGCLPFQYWASGKQLTGKTDSAA